MPTVLQNRNSKPPSVLKGTHKVSLQAPLNLANSTLGSYMCKLSMSKKLLQMLNQIFHFTCSTNMQTPT